MKTVLALACAALLCAQGCDVPAAPDLQADGAGRGVTNQVRFPVEKMVPGGRHAIIDVVDGDTVTLKTRRDVRMVGTQAPKLPLGRANFEAWPLGDAAKDYLEDLAGGQSVTLYFGGREVDRHNRWLAHMVRADGLWLQGAMLEAGYARVYTFPDNRGGIRAMLQAEAIARDNQRGIWNHPYYKVRQPKELEGALDTYLNTYQIVRGRVASTGEAGGRIFINFGGDYKTDFTAVIERTARRRYGDAAEFDRDRLEGAMIELRGWIERNNGPSVDISHPEQIVYLK